jgi:hypothetical protein
MTQVNEATMVAYHGDPEIKAKLLARIAEHERLDTIIKGLVEAGLAIRELVGGDQGRWTFAGKRISDEAALALLSLVDHANQGAALLPEEPDDHTPLEATHSLYPERLGLPEWLALLEDAIFEGLPEDEALTWPRRFAEAVPVGADLSGLEDSLAVRRMRERLLPLAWSWPDSLRDEVVGAIEGVVAALERGHDAELRSAAESAARLAARSALSAARSAAWSARSAARSAAWSALSAAESAARSAARSARSARSAAWSAAGSAAQAARSPTGSKRSAAWSARSAAWSAESAALLDALRALPVPEAAWGVGMLVKPSPATMERAAQVARERGWLEVAKPPALKRAYRLMSNAEPRDQGKWGREAMEVLRRAIVEGKPPAESREAAALERFKKIAEDAYHMSADHIVIELDKAYGEFWGNNNEGGRDGSI